MLASGPDGADSFITIPSTASYDGATYDVTALGAYAFYLSGAAEASLPASVASIDERAFRSSDVEHVAIDPANPTYASFDGVIYDADLTRLLLIPGGRGGAVLVPDAAEEVPASAFSHCTGVDAIAVAEGSPAFSSWDGLLYDASGITLLRVPAGATDISIREGCTAIAAGALEGCARLERIEAPASVIYISPEAFESVPTVSLPAAAVKGGDSSTQINAMVALSSTGDSLPSIDASSIEVSIFEDASSAPWASAGFSVRKMTAQAIIPVEDVSVPVASQQSAASAYDATYSSTLISNGGSFYSTFVGGYVSNLTHSSPAFWWSVSGGGQSIQCLNDSWQVIDNITLLSRTDCTFIGWSVNQVNAAAAYTSGNWPFNTTSSLVANWRVKVTWNPNGGYWGTDPSATSVKTSTADNGTAQNTYDGLTMPTRPGYKLLGWSTNYAATAGVTTVTIPNSPVVYYAIWEALPITTSCYRQDGTSQSETLIAYDAKAYPRPTMSLQRPGYTFAGVFSRPGHHLLDANLNMVYAYSYVRDGTEIDYRWTANTITCVWNSCSGSAIGNTSATYSPDAKVPMPSSEPARTGYVFAGWWTAAEGGTEVTVSTALPTDNTTYYAHWTPALSVDVPLEVTARIDRLGIEEQVEATGYLESRSGGALKVAAIDVLPLEGAAELFGNANLADVLLKAIPSNDASKAVSFALDTPVTETDAGALTAFELPDGYGSRVGVAYRFDIPDELLPALPETTKQVVSVYYTVALA